MEAVPTVIDQVRALVTQRAALIAQRVQIDGDVSWIDEQLEEARQLLGVTLAPPAAAPTPVQARPVSAPVVTAPARVKTLPTRTACTWSSRRRRTGRCATTACRRPSGAAIRSARTSWESAGSKEGYARRRSGSTR
jgi:hypothetical protein